MFKLYLMKPNSAKLNSSFPKANLIQLSWKNHSTKKFNTDAANRMFPKENLIQLAIDIR